MIIKLCGRKIKVFIVDQLPGYDQGIAKFKEMEIVIARTCNDPMAVFIHEIYHHWANITGVDWDSTITNEPQADICGAMISGLIHENKITIFEDFLEEYNGK